MKSLVISSLSIRSETELLEASPLAYLRSISCSPQRSNKLTRSANLEDEREDEDEDDDDDDDAINDAGELALCKAVQQ